MNIKKIICILLLIILGFVNITYAQLLDAKVYHTEDNGDLIGTTIYDVSNYPYYNGTLISGVTTGINGVINEAFRLDGINEYINTSINNFTNRYTISFWFNTSNTHQTQVRIIDGRLPNNNAVSVAFTTGGAGAGLKFLHNGAGEVRIPANQLNNNTWYHVVALYDGSNAKLFLNNTQQFGASTETFGVASSTITVGAYNSPTQFFKGSIDEVAIYDRALTTSEITELYNNHQGFNPFNITVTPPISRNVVRWYNTTGINITLNTSTDTNMSYVLNAGAETSICNECNSTVLELLGLTPNILNNITWISTDIHGQKNTSDNFTVDITPPVIQQLANISNNTFSINFSNILNVTDNVSGLVSCLINITELENVTTPDNFLINCTDTQIFNTSGLHNAFVTAIDNASNKQTYDFNFSIIPFVTINFKDTSNNFIYNYSVTIYHPNNRIETRSDNNGNITLSPVNNGTLDLGIHTLMFNKLGYLLQNFSINVTETSGGETYTFNASDSIISITIRDKVTGAIVNETNFSIDLIATVGVSTSTIIGIKNITNVFFLEEEYRVIVSSVSYETESIFFDFNNQEIINLDVYVINSSDANLGYVVVSVVNRFSKPLEGIAVRALQWDAVTSTYIPVSEGKTGSLGTASLNVILDDKLYKFRAIGTTGFVDSIDQIIPTADNGKTIPLVLSDVVSEFFYLYENLLITGTENFNNVTNISQVTASWEDKTGIQQTICINAYRITNNDEIKLTNDTANCDTSVSGTLQRNFFINSTYDIVLKIEVKLDNNYFEFYKFPHYSNTHISNIIRNQKLDYFIITLLNIVSISVGLYLSNPYIGSILLIFVAIFSIKLVPTLITGGIVAFIIFIHTMTIIGGKTQ